MPPSPFSAEVSTVVSPRSSVRAQPQHNVVRLKRTFGALALALGLLACRRTERATAVPLTPRVAAPAPARGPVLGYIDESRLGKPVDGGVLRRRLIGEPGTLNALMQSSTTEQEVIAYLSRNLLDFDPALNLVPGLAEKYEVSPDGRTFRFWLRRDAVWEDGTPVTSADAVFTIRHIQNPKIPAPVFKTVFEGLEAVEAIDARTFTVRFRDFYAYRPMAFVVPLLPERRFTGVDFPTTAPRSPTARTAWSPGNPRSPSGSSETRATGGIALISTA